MQYTPIIVLHLKHTMEPCENTSTWDALVIIIIILCSIRTIIFSSFTS
jgi:hypothetical protein